MKKKLALILSIVLVLAAVVCLFALPASATDEFVNANTTAKALWSAVVSDKKATAFSLTTTTSADLASASGNLADVKEGWTGTYTFADGVLTLHGSGNTLDGVNITANGALWLVLDNVSLSANSGVINTTSLLVKSGETDGKNQAPDVDLPVIVSSPIDDEFNLTEDGVGGMIIGQTSNTIRHNCSLVIMGDVGFEIAKTSTVMNANDLIFAARANPNYRKTVVIANGRESVLGPTGGTGIVLGLQFGGTLIFDNTAKLTINGSFYNVATLIDFVEFQNKAEVVVGVAGTNNFSNFLAEDNAKVSFICPVGKTNPLKVTETLTTDDNAVVKVSIPGSTGNWAFGINANAVKMLGGTIDIDATCTDTTDAFEAFHIEGGSAEFLGGTLNVKVNAPNYTRGHGIFFKNQTAGEDVINFGGTNVNFDLTQKADSTSPVGCVTAQEVSAEIKVTGGIITVNAPSYKDGIFCLRGSQAMTLSLTGGRILGTAKSVVTTRDIAHTVNFGRDICVALDGIEKPINQLNLSTFNLGSIDYIQNSDYLHLMNSSDYGRIVTANAVTAKAALVKIFDAAGTAHYLNLSDNVYPAGATGSAVQATLTEAGKLVTNNLTATRIEAYGALTVDVNGLNNKLSGSDTNLAGIQVNGSLTVTSDGASGVDALLIETTGTKALYSAYGDLTVSGSPVVTLKANAEAILTDATAGAIIFKDNAKVNVTTEWRGAVKAQGKNADGDGIVIQDNAALDLNCGAHLALWFEGAKVGNLKMTGGSVTAVGGYEFISARNCADGFAMNILGGSVTLDSTKLASETGDFWSYFNNFTKDGKIVIQNATVNMGTTRKFDTSLCAAINAGNGVSVEFKNGANVTAYGRRSVLLVKDGATLKIEDGADVKAYGNHDILYAQSGATDVIMTGGTLTVESVAGLTVRNLGSGSMQFLGGTVNMKSSDGVYGANNSDGEGANLVFGSEGRTTVVNSQGGRFLYVDGYNPTVHIIGANTTVTHTMTKNADGIYVHASSDADTSSDTNVQKASLKVDGATLKILSSSTGKAACAVRLNGSGLGNKGVCMVEMAINNANVEMEGTGQVLYLSGSDGADGSKATLSITGASNVNLKNVGTHTAIQVNSKASTDLVIDGTSQVTLTTGSAGEATARALWVNAPNSNLIVKGSAKLIVNARTKDGNAAIYVNGNVKVQGTATLNVAQTGANGGNAIYAVKDVIFEDTPNVTVSSRKEVLTSESGSIQILGGTLKADNIQGTNNFSVIKAPKGIVFNAKVDVNTIEGADTKSKWSVFGNGTGDIVFKSNANVQIYGLNSSLFMGNNNAVTGNMIFETGCVVNVYSADTQGIRFQKAAGNLQLKGGTVTVNSKGDALLMDGAGVGDVLISGGELKLTARNGNALVISGGSELKMTGGKLTVNATGYDIINQYGTAKDGGQIYFEDAEVNLTTTGAFAIYTGQKATLTLLDSNVTINTAKSGICATGNMIVDEGTKLYIKNNLSTGSGWTYGIDAQNLYVDGADTLIDIKMTGSLKDPTVGIGVSDQTAIFNDGTVNILIDNDNAASANRNHGLFFKTKQKIELAGTDFNVVMNLDISDTYLAGMICTQDITTPINISAGNLDFRGNKNVNAFVKMRANGGILNITGGTITGSAKYFFDTQSGTNKNAKVSFYDQMVTIAPEAKIDFFSYSNTYYLGQFNNDNQTYYNGYSDTGVEYLTGCGLANNSKFLTTANMTVDGATTQVTLKTNSGETVALYINPAADNNRIFYGDNGEPAVILNAGGNVTVVDSVDVAALSANGNTIITVEGENVFNNPKSTHNISANGAITLKGEGSLELTGTQYVVYSMVGITVKDDVELSVASTGGCGIHVGRNNPASYLHITDNAVVTVASAGGAGNAIYLPGYNVTTTIDGNAKVDLTAEAAGIYMLNDSPDGVSGSATINVGGDAVLTVDAKNGLYTKGGNSTVNIYGNADVDISNPGTGIRAEGANCSVNISDNADVLIDTPAGDALYINSNVVGASGIPQVAELNVSDNAKLTAIDAGSCGARMLVNATDSDKNAVAGKANFSATGNANVDLTANGQCIYLNSTAKGSSANFTMADASNVNLTNTEVTGRYGSALTVYSMDNNVKITSTGTLNAIGHASSWNGAVYIRRAATTGATSDILIKDTTVNVTNISTCALTDKEVKGNASEVSNAFFVTGDGVFEITGNAVVNAYAEKNGTEFANRAHGIFLGDNDNMTMKISGRAKATFTGAGDSKASTGAGIHAKSSNIIVTDRATLKAYGKGTAVAGITFENDASLTVNGYGWADIKVAADGGAGIRSYNAKTTAKVTAEEGGLITITGDPAYKKAAKQITISATGALAGDDKASAVEVAPDKLTGKEGYIRLNGVNPNTSDFTITFVAIAAVVVAVAAAGVVILVRRKKAQED